MLARLLFSYSDGILFILLLITVLRTAISEVVFCLHRGPADTLTGPWLQERGLQKSPDPL